MPPLRLFLDANVIYDAHLRDFFLRLHEAELVTIIWSEYALEPRSDNRPSARSSS